MSNENTALATRPNPAAAMMAEAFGMDGNFFPKPTNVFLNQKPDDGREPGAYYDTQANEKFDALPIVALKFSEGRVFFEDDTLGAKPLCKSFDGKLPVLNDPDIVRQDGGKGCKGCPRAQWKQVRGPGGKLIKVKPECAENLTLLFVNLNSGFAHRINVKRTAVPPTKEYREKLFKKVVEQQMKKNLVPHFAFVANLRSTQVVNKRGQKYFEPLFDSPTLITTEILEKYGIGDTPEEYINRMATMYDFYVNRTNAIAEEEVTEAKVEAKVEEVMEGEYEQA